MSESLREGYQTKGAGCSYICDCGGGAESILVGDSPKTSLERPQYGPVIPLPSKKVVLLLQGNKGGTACFTSLTLCSSDVRDLFILQGIPQESL